MLWPNQNNTFSSRLRLRIPNPLIHGWGELSPQLRFLEDIAAIRADIHSGTLSLYLRGFTRCKANNSTFAESDNFLNETSSFIIKSL